MFWVILGAIICLGCFLMGLAFANKIAQNTLDEKRSEMQLDCEEPNMWIDGVWYTETELENKFHEMQMEIEELKKSVDIYRTMANNAMLERNDESEVCD
jgi:hypothetical protein